MLVFLPSSSHGAVIITRGNLNTMIEPRDESEVEMVLVNHLFKDTIGPSWVSKTTDLVMMKS